MNILHQIEAYPHDTISGTVLLEMGFLSKNCKQNDYLEKHYGVKPIHLGKSWNGKVRYFYSKTELLSGIADKLAAGRRSSQGPQLRLLRELSVAAPTPAPTPDLPTLFERFQRDFAATIDALHQDMADRDAAQQRRAEHLAAVAEGIAAEWKHMLDAKLDRMDAKIDREQGTKATLIKQLKAIATLTDTVHAWVKPTREATERIELQLDQIAVYFENQKEVNKIIFKKVDATHNDIKILNEELGVSA